MGHTHLCRGTSPGRMCMYLERGAGNFELGGCGHRPRLSRSDQTRWVDEMEAGAAEKAEQAARDDRGVGCTYSLAASAIPDAQGTARGGPTQSRGRWLPSVSRKLWRTDGQCRPRPWCVAEARTCSCHAGAAGAPDTSASRSDL